MTDTSTHSIEPDTTYRGWIYRGDCVSWRRFTTHGEARRYGHQDPTIDKIVKAHPDNNHEIIIYER